MKNIISNLKGEIMTEEYKKYYQMIFSVLDGINPRYWCKIRNKFTIDNNSIVLIPSKKGVLVYTENTEKILFTELIEIKNYLKEKKPNVFNN